MRMRAVRIYVPPVGALYVCLFSEALVRTSVLTLVHQASSPMASRGSALPIPAMEQSFSLYSRRLISANDSDVSVACPLCGKVS